MNAPVLFEEKTAANGVRFGIATLNSPQTLNGLSLEMVDLLASQLMPGRMIPAWPWWSCRARATRPSAPAATCTACTAA